MAARHRLICRGSFIININQFYTLTITKKISNFVFCVVASCRTACCALILTFACSLYRCHARFLPLRVRCSLSLRRSPSRLHRQHLEKSLPCHFAFKTARACSREGLETAVLPVTRAPLAMRVNCK